MLFDAVIDYLPNPLDLPPMTGTRDVGNDQTETVEIKPDDNGKVTGLAFKLATDPYVGKLIFCRIYSGILKKGVSSIILVHGNRNVSAD